ncbi:hypothetical protein [Actinomadura sp. 9N407]|uniref:hypothetical protein n=1 Tax=Actinomadura sp. 9N407 TaxID=3375154 RepID=UPI00378B2B84
MELDTDAPLREECWASMGQAIRNRLVERAGTVLDWWARQDPSDPDRRPHAAVLGDRALCVAEPRIDTGHRAVYSLSAYEFDPATFRTMAIEYRPLPGAPGAPAATTPAAPGGAAPDIGLSRSARELLGNLPGKAQELLQAPFLRGQKVLRCDWHYEGSEHRLDMFMAYLAGPNDVTAVSGTKVVPAGHTEATAHWSLLCRRASVRRRAGQ